MRCAHDAGLSAIALTDHDTLAGVPDAQAAGAALGVRVIAGCEFSVRVAWGELHLLGYFLPVGDARLEAFLAEARSARERRGRQMVEKLHRLGIPLDLDRVTAAARGGALGRPHVARVLQAEGHVTSFEEAFWRFLGRGKPAFVEKPLPPLRDITRLVHEIGGLAVAAHLGDRGTEAGVRELVAGGIDGVEVRHPSHDAATESRLLRVAQLLSIGKSGGSDWHGEREASSSHAPLGGLKVPEEWLRELEERRDRHQQQNAQREARRT